MSKKNPPAKWVLPAVVDPPTRRCIQVPVPDEPQHIAAFWGALLTLSSAYKWADDPSHTAREVALVWRDIIDGISWGCDPTMFDVRQNVLNPCTLEKTEDGAIWTAWADLQKCPPRIRINDGIVQWYNPTTGLWEPVDGGDEREDGEAPPPWPDNPDGACLAAENITAVYQTTLTQIRAGVAAAQAATLIAATITGIAGVFINPAIYSSVALAITYAALSLTTVGLDIMLSPEHLESFKCEVYKYAAADGSITASAFTDIRAGMATWASGLELELIEYYLDGYGSVGLQRQGAAGGITTGDCGCGLIHLNYIFGNGPAWVEDGGMITVTMTSSIDPSHFEVDVTTATGVCVDFEVVAIRNFVSQIPEYGPWDGACQPCGSTGWTDTFVFAGPTTYFNKNGFGINSLDSECEVDLRITLVP